MKKDETITITAEFRVDGEDALDARVPAFPFDAGELAEAKAEFLENAEWARLYNNAPELAKLRLEYAFWFSVHGNKKDDAAICEGLAYRRNLEEAMDIDSLRYLANEMLGKAREHYRKVLEERTSPVTPKYMEPEKFFAHVKEQGEYTCYQYDEDTKKSILRSFIPVLKHSRDPLRAFLEDILASGKLREVRVFPKEEWMYVRVETQFIGDDGEWSRPYQLVALWDCFNRLQGYSFVSEKPGENVWPAELCQSRDGSSQAAWTKRAELRAARESEVAE